MAMNLPADERDVKKEGAGSIEELELRLSNLSFHKIADNVRPSGIAQLIYKPGATSMAAVRSDQWNLIAPLGPIEAQDLRWYLEVWPRWPNIVLSERARQVERNLITWGHALYCSALPPEITADAVQAWRCVNRRGNHRFSVSVDASLDPDASESEHKAAMHARTALLALPWELMHDGESFLFQGESPCAVRRCLHNTRTLQKHSETESNTDPIIRILLVTARPEDEVCGFIDHRASALPLVGATETLGELLHLRFLHPPTFIALEEELERATKAGESYNVIHFDCHGLFDRARGMGGLCFEDPRDTRKLTHRRHETVYTDRLGPLLNAYRVPLVVLEACQSARAEDGSESVALALLQGGVPSVVAMSHSVLVETARRFMANFYADLAKGQRVGGAMLAGQRALYDDPRRGNRIGIVELAMVDWFVPVLYQGQDDPSLFNASSASRGTGGNQFDLKTRSGELPEAPAKTGFVGRSRDLLALERLLQQERWVVLRGQGGEGKTAVAAELARWLIRSKQIHRAAFMYIELSSDEGSVLDALGLQLVGENYFGFKHENLEKALIPIRQALSEHPTLIVIDNMESVLIPPCLDIPDYTRQKEAQQLDGIIDLAMRLLTMGETKIIFTSREALPAPFNAIRQVRELHPLNLDDAIEFVELSLVNTDGPEFQADTPHEQHAAIQDLVQEVQCNARTITLLNSELSHLGIETTRVMIADILEKMDNAYPGNKEKSPFASIESSLNRLPLIYKGLAPVLGVFHRGVDLNVLMWMMGWEPAVARALARELVATGLATMNQYGHLSLSFPLCPYLKKKLPANGLDFLMSRWKEAMTHRLDLLYSQEEDDPSKMLVILDFPNYIALLEQSQTLANTQDTAESATKIRRLLINRGEPRMLEKIQKIMGSPNIVYSEIWSHASFMAISTRIEQQVVSGQVGEAEIGARNLLLQAQAAGEQSYLGADYDLAIAYLLLSKAYQAGGNARKALPLLVEAGRRFEEITSKRESIGSEKMKSECIALRGTCLRDLGLYQDAADAYEEVISRREPDDPYGAAIAKGQLGIVRRFQHRFKDALNAFIEARETFNQLNDPRRESLYLYELGMTYLDLQEPLEAEESLHQSLSISEETKNYDMQFRSLVALGILYDEFLDKPNDAVIVLQKTAQLYHDLGNFIGEAAVFNNLSIALRKLNRLDDARQAVEHAISIQTYYGDVGEPWKNLAVLSDIESDAGNQLAASEARNKAIKAFLAHRRNGGHDNSAPARLSKEVYQCLRVGDSPAATLLLQVRAADPTWANAPAYIYALHAITGGSRNRTIVEDRGLDIYEAAELLLLIDALEKL